MAINRYCVAYRSAVSGAVFNVTRTWFYCACVWLLSFLMSMIPATGLCCRKIFDVHHDAKDEDIKNERNNPLKIMTYVFDWSTVLVMGFCYISVFFKIRKSGAVHAQPQSSRQLEQLAKKEKLRRNISIQFCVISVVFWLLLCFQIVTQSGYRQKGVIATLQYLYTLNSAVNPVIYLGFNPSLRKQVFKLLFYFCMSKDSVQVL